MPIYEYRCSSCGHELEALQKFSDPPLTACPSCKLDALVKLVSAAGFQLKGSGWYATDFKGSGKPAAAKDTGEAKPDAKAESKGEPKTAGDSGSKSEGASAVAAPASATGGTPASS
jgi:putative FmdB family regulatory protein